MNIILQTGHTGGGKDTKRKTVDCLLCSLGPHKERPTRSTKTYQDHERKLQKQMVSDPRRNLLDQSGKAQEEGLTFWRTDLMPLSLTTQNLLTAFSSGGH